MFYANTFTLKMENKKMAAKALEVMREALAQIDADGFKYDSRKTVDDFANDLMVKGSAVIAPGNCGLMPDANHIAIPEMFKAVARCFCFDKFTAKVFSTSSYVWEAFEISYEDGELVINSLYHDNCEEPFCEECDDCYDYFEEDGVAGYRCCDCGHTITVEEFKATCEQYFENVYSIL